MSADDAAPGPVPNEEWTAVLDKGLSDITMALRTITPAIRSAMQALAAIDAALAEHEARTAQQSQAHLRHRGQ